MSRTQHEKKAINRLLAQNGLGQLTDPGLVSQIGFLMGQACTTHEHFRDMLNASHGQDRREMYEAMKPYLRFEAKPLDVYVAELASIAERKQLPTLGPNGELLPYRPTEVVTDPVKAERDAEELKLANQLAAAAVAKKQLWLVCARCTKEAVFYGTFKSDCVDAARASGWEYRGMPEPAEICPDCTGRPAIPQKLAA